jgi:hypothetical protein
MKLRIQGNSLRLRVTPKEVAQLRDRGRVESLIEFGWDSPLIYSLEASDGVGSVAASFDGGAIRVAVPAPTMAKWIQSDQVGIEAVADNGLGLIIEKDFQCLHKVVQDPDAYPNPLVS